MHQRGFDDDRSVKSSWTVKVLDVNYLSCMKEKTERRDTMIGSQLQHTFEGASYKAYQVSFPKPQKGNELLESVNRLPFVPCGILRNRYPSKVSGSEKVAGSRAIAITGAHMTAPGATYKPSEKV